MKMSLPTMQVSSIIEREMQIETLFVSYLHLI